MILGGNLYIADNISAIRKVNTSGIINTIAGTTVQNESGDGGQATAAHLFNPIGLATDATGNLYIADWGNNRIRVINTSGIINSIVGNGTAGYSGDGGTPNAAELDGPYSIALNAGKLYISDQVNNRIRAVYTCTANAGTNQTNNQTCCGWPGVQIGTTAISGYTYSWTPSTKLSSTTVAQPTSTWTNSSTCEVYMVTASYSLCTVNSSTVQVCAHAFSGSSCCRIATGITTNGQEVKAFAVYPNPANAIVTLSLYDNTDYIHITDFQGRLVYETKETVAGDFKLDISKYASGIYFISVKIGDVIEKQKLIVE